MAQTTSEPTNPAGELAERNATLRSLIHATDLAPDNGELQLQLARALESAGEIVKAIGHYQCALALAPSSLEILLRLAAALRAARRLEGSLALSRRALELAPDSAEARYQLDQALAEQRVSVPSPRAT